MRADNSPHIVAAARERAAATRERAIATLRRMDAAGQPFSFDAVGVPVVLAEKTTLCRAAAPDLA